MRNLQRREFLQISVSAASALSLTGVSLKAASSKTQQMTLGFSTYGMKTMTTEQAIQSISKIGFDAVEITVRSDWDASPENMSITRRHKIRNLLQKHHLKLTSLMEHLPLKNDEITHRKHLARLQQVCDLAHALSPDDPPLIQTVLGGGEWDKAKHWYRDQLADWVKLAEKNKIVIAIKPHRGGGMSRPSEAVWLIEQLDKSPSLKMVYDFSHYAFRDMTMPQTVKTALPYMAHVAVKDTIQKDGKTRFVLPGESGNFDYGKLLKLLADGGYRGDISCEVSGMVWGQKNYQPITAAKICYKNIAQAFSKADISRPE